ncbi:MAG: polyprenyl synthetase family protein [Actinobacteria bacterium]|nr:MAG: polyprenyl synthetase family protein [Actinomycetota bacterium]
MIDVELEVLGRARDLAYPATRRAVMTLHDDLRRPTEYHLGWTDVDGTPLGGKGGKGVRAALAIVSAEAAHAPGLVGVPGAVAIELIHNFSLLHDDIIDTDRERRHRPTVWAVFGVGSAIIVGDALMALAPRVLLEEVTPARVNATRRLFDATAAMIEGQADDMAFESAADVTLPDCLRMVERKTGALLAFASSVGAVLAGADTEVVDALESYGHHLGIAFQALDDLLGIWGDPRVTGKPVGGDLAQRKKTLPVCAALACERLEAAELSALFASGSLDERAIARASQLVEAAGGREFTEQLAETHLTRALDALRSSALDDHAVAQLEALARFVTKRDH